MTKKLKTSRNQNLMQRIYSCNDYVCMHKREPEGFRKRRKSPTVLVENWCRFRSRQLLYHFLFICCDDVPSFFRKYNQIPCISKFFEILHKVHTLKSLLSVQQILFCLGKFFHQLVHALLEHPRLLISENLPQILFFLI